jgi:hypothetical protein
MDLSDEEDEIEVDGDEEVPVGWNINSKFSSNIQEEDDEDGDELEPQYDDGEDGYTSTSSVEIEIPVKKIKRSRIVATPFVDVLQEEYDFK